VVDYNGHEASQNRDPKCMTYIMLNLETVGTVEYIMSAVGAASYCCSDASVKSGHVARKLHGTCVLKLLSWIQQIYFTNFC